MNMKIKKFKDWGISSKIIGVAFSSALFIALLVLLYLLPAMADRMKEDKVDAVKQVVETAYSVLQGYGDLVKQNKIPLSEAKEEAIDKIKNLRYSGNEYFWLNDMYPKMIMHPFKPQLDGHDLSSNKDPNGVYLFKEFVKVCRVNGEGYVEYMWPKPGFDKPQPKISYVKLFKDWGWIIGSGVYVNDINAAISNLRVKVFIGLFIAFIFFTITGLFLGRYIVKPLKRLTEASERIEKGENEIVINIDADDEIGKLARAFNSMTEKIMIQNQHLDDLTGPVMIIDPDFSIRYMNKKGAEIVGKNPKELIGLKCYDQFKADHCHTENCALYKAMKFDKIYTEETISRINGSEIPIIYSGSPVKDREGKVVGALELITPIKEIKDLQDYLTRSTNRMMLAMEEFEKGDLTVNLKPEKEDDDIGKLFKGFNKTVGYIRQTIETIVKAIQTTASSSTEISSSTEQMAGGLQEQSAQTSEVATAIEQMTKAILETTKSTGAAVVNAKNAGHIAKEGGQIVEETVLGMERIADTVNKAVSTVRKLGKNSDEIGKIIQVIDDIADQTNLLALNAAIEAARAGEMGRGFAVVADEVRKLAERTTTATKEISGMIKQIQNDTSLAVSSIEEGNEEVEKGREKANKAGESLKQIINASNNVVDDINQIASTAEEQSTTAEQISKNIESINSVTQESAAGIQQVAHTAENLNKLTRNLEELINKFKLNEESHNHSGESSFAVRSNGKIVHSV